MLFVFTEEDPGLKRISVPSTQSPHAREKTFGIQGTSPGHLSQQVPLSSPYHLLQRSSEGVVTLSLANVGAAIFEQTVKAFQICT